MLTGETRILTDALKDLGWDLAPAPHDSHLPALPLAAARMPKVKVRTESSPSRAPRDGKGVCPSSLPMAAKRRTGKQDQDRTGIAWGTRRRDVIKSPEGNGPRR